MSSSIDWVTILLYAALVLFGWINIYAAVYNDDHRSIFDLSQNYGKQLLWIGISMFVALSIILIEGRFYHMFAYPIYWTMLLVMLAVMLFGKEVNGAKSWIDLGGGIRIQPVEFMKIATALALARYMSSYNLNIREFKTLYNIGLIIFVPVMLILLQNDTGSALVFFGFFVMLYREGFNKVLYILVGFIILLGVISFLLEPLAVLLIIILLCLVGEAVINRRWMNSVKYLAIITIITILITVAGLVIGVELSPYISIIIAIVLSLPLLGRYAFANRLDNIWMFVAIFVGALLFTFFVDYAFDNMLQIHQQKRILDLLGIENDPQGWSYNVIQSKIAIGSGGLWGKGFLDGTQTRFSFVPEQDTDFIFCTIGEEWGFLGSIALVAAFIALIIRLMKMGERQKEPFARVYCYCVASILLMHFVINISMTIGLFPVVGIPLPFFSYGGSSLLAFTILLFIAIRLDYKNYDDASGSSHI